MLLKERYYGCYGKDIGSTEDVTDEEIIATIGDLPLILAVAPSVYDIINAKIEDCDFSDELVEELKKLGIDTIKELIKHEGNYFEEKCNWSHIKVANLDCKLHEGGLRLGADEEDLEDLVYECERESKFEDEGEEYSSFYLYSRRHYHELTTGNFVLVNENKLLELTNDFKKKYNKEVLSNPANKQLIEETINPYIRQRHTAELSEIEDKQIVYNINEAQEIAEVDDFIYDRTHKIPEVDDFMGFLGDQTHDKSRKWYALISISFLTLYIFFIVFIVWIVTFFCQKV